MRGFGGKVRGAPVFPSLRSEGKKGGGYDVEIPRSGAPLFLQFKIPQVVTRKSIMQPPGFSLPYYRMHLRPCRHSTQHQSLLRHEGRGRLVYYVTPVFHKTEDLNKYYDSHEVVHNSAFVRPRQIGKLDDDPHYVAYMLGNSNGWLRSQLTRLDGRINSRHFFDEIEHSLDIVPPATIGHDFFSPLAEEIIETVGDVAREVEQRARERPPSTREQFSPTWEEGYYSAVEEVVQKRKENVRNRYLSLGDHFSPAGQVGYLARFYLDSELFILGRE